MSTTRKIRCTDCGEAGPVRAPVLPVVRDAARVGRRRRPPCTDARGRRIDADRRRAAAAADVDLPRPPPIADAGPTGRCSPGRPRRPPPRPVAQRAAAQLDAGPDDRSSGPSTRRRRRLRPGDRRRDRRRRPSGGRLGGPRRRRADRPPPRRRRRPSWPTASAAAPSRRAPASPCRDRPRPSRLDRAPASTAGLEWAAGARRRARSRSRCSCPGRAASSARAGVGYFDSWGLAGPGHVLAPARLAGRARCSAVLPTSVPIWISRGLGAAGPRRASRSA